jgi:GT2 family glycosyltransferase
MKVSIVITTRNRKHDLLRCVRSLKASLFKDYELIVVDDSSTDGTEFLEPSDLAVPVSRIIHAPHQMMMAGSRNTGARQARAPYVLFIDDDNVLDAEMVGILVAAADTHKEYGILGPSMFLLRGNKRHLDFQKVSLLTGRTFRGIDTTTRRICDSDGIPNVFMVKTTVFDGCGYFDETLLQTYTEPDLALRAARQGFKCGIVKDAKTMHDISEDEIFTPRSQGGTDPQKAYCLMRNRTVIVARYGRWCQKLIYGLVFAWMWPVVYSALMLRYRRFDLIKLYWYGFRDGMWYLLTGRLRNSLPLLPETGNREQKQTKATKIEK